ncbi:MAG: DUF2336 domain-containing protein [Parvibaculum sp.]|nr:DUF2336 domain-containing protein [Parvibaculum sp.]
MALGTTQAINTGDDDVSLDTHARGLLLRRMSDLAVLPPGRLTAQERALVDLVLASGVSRLDVVSRKRLAERVAQLPEGPAELTLALARDEIEVAGPVLRGSVGLPSGELVQIIREASDAHHLAIAERKHLPGAVVDALVEHAELAAHCRLLANPAAEVSNRSLEILVRRSAAEEELQPLLLARSEMNIRLAQLMFWWVSPEARREILTRYSVERRQLYTALDDVLESGLAASATDEVLQAALSLVRMPVLATKQQSARLVDHATRHSRDELIAEISFMGRVRPETAYRIFSDIGGEPMAVFGKAVGMSRSEFSDLLSALASMRGLDPDDVRSQTRVSTVFDMISNDRADFVLHCWDWAMSADAQMPIDG